MAYTGENEYGGGCLVPKAPLTDRGRWLIDAMADAGITVDLAHAGRRTAWEALDYSRRRYPHLPVVATHVACAKIYKHPRNLPDGILAELDYIGLVATSWMLSGNRETDQNLDPFLRHLVHLLQICRPEQICLGTDMVYQPRQATKELEEFRVLGPKLDPTGELGVRVPEWPDAIAGAGRLQILRERLGHYLSEGSLEKICGDNLRRLLDGTRLIFK